MLVGVPVAPVEPAPQPVPVVQEEEVSRETEWTFETLLPYLANKYNVNETLARNIIACESRNDPNAKNDNYTEGVYWSSDYGYWQINDYHHESVASKRGFNIYVWEENLEYGFLLLKEQGTQPWRASQHCWGDV